MLNGPHTQSWMQATMSASLCISLQLDMNTNTNARLLVGQAAVAEDDTVFTGQASIGGSSGSGHHWRSLSRGSGPWSRRESRPPRLARAPPSEPRQGLQALKTAFIASGAALGEPSAADPQVRVTQR